MEKEYWMLICFLDGTQTLYNLSSLELSNFTNQADSAKKLNYNWIPIKEVVSTHENEQETIINQINIDLVARYRFSKNRQVLVQS